MASRLADIGIRSLEDLVFHFPLRYQDRTKISAIGGLRDQVDAVVEAEVRAAAVTMGFTPRGLIAHPHANEKHVSPHDLHTIQMHHVASLDHFKGVLNRRQRWQRRMEEVPATYTESSDCSGGDDDPTLIGDDAYVNVNFCEGASGDENGAAERDEMYAGMNMQDANHHDMVAVEF